MQEQETEQSMTAAEADLDRPFAERALAWLLLVGGAIGFVAAFALTVERIELLKDPSYTPTCTINPVLSCGSVMTTEQASLLGFPNPLIGIAAFAGVATIGATLLAGARLARWFWLGLQIGVVIGVGFVGWLIFQSIYRIGALCPYCMVVWAVMVPIFWYVTLRNAVTGVLGAGVARSAAVRGLRAWHAVGLTLIVVLVVVLVLEHFWFYWSTLV